MSDVGVIFRDRVLRVESTHNSSSDNTVNDIIVYLELVREEGIFHLQEEMGILVDGGVGGK